MSEPVASVQVPAARLAPEPPDDPPQVRSGFHGLRVTPCSSDQVTAAIENSGVVVRAWTIAPASSSRCTKGSVPVATWSANSSEPSVTRWPSMWTSSFTASASPSSGRFVPVA